MVDVIASSDKSLDRSIDVQVSVTKNQIEGATDLSVLLFVTKDAPYDQGAGRVRLYTDMEAVAEDFGSSQQAYRAATTFFSQPRRSATFAVGKMFVDPVAGFMKTKAVGTDVNAWKAVTDGSFNITVDGSSVDVTALDFSSVTSLDDVASVVSAGSAAFSCVNSNGQFIFTSATTGDLSTVSALATVDPASGTDISGELFLNGQDDAGDPTDDVIIVPGYAPTGQIADELDLIEEAASTTGTFVYGWCMDKTFRDSQDQIDTATWIEARKANLALCLNSPFVKDPASTSDIGYLLSQTANIRTFTTYHDNAYYYPEVAIMAQMLGVDYRSENATITAKFKDLVGIPTVGVNSTDMAVLLSKRVNTFTAVGNNARTYREGQQENSAWFIDDLINLDNFEEELQTAVYNVFLQNGKVPYNEKGINLLRSAIVSVCERYVFNGTLSERQISVTAGDNKPSIEPAYIITNTPLALVSDSDRAQRIGPPFKVKLNLTGAIHSVSIDVNAYA